MKPKFIFFLFLAAILIAPFSALRAEDVSVTSSFDKRSAQVNEEIHLTIRINGGQGNIQAPHLPGFKGFDTFYTGRASHLTFINNQSSSSVEFSYVLVPKMAGKFTMNPIEVTVNGQNFRTEPIDIEVLGDSGGVSQRPSSSQAAPSPGPLLPPQPPSSSAPSSGAPQQEPPPTYQPNDDNIFVKAWVDKTSVYPNEQIVLSYSLYTRYDTRYEGFEEEPQVSGFWIEEFPAEREIPRETVRIEGKRYVKADVKKVALFPTTAADYTIQPGSIKVSIRQEPQTTSVFDEFFNDSFFSGGSFFARRENRLLKPPPITVKVKPFPPGQPESFEGAVGNFRMNATIDKDSVKQDEPVTMKLTIEGEGNIETLNKPKLPELPDFKVYDADTSSQLFKNGNVIGGRKTFEVVFIPMKSGALKIPKLQFSFFNPATAAYQTLATPEFPLKVAASDQPFKLPASLSQQEVFKKDVQAETRDIRYIHENLPNEKSRILFRNVMRGFAGADVILTFLVFFGLLRERQERIFEKDNALKRRRFARAQAEGRIRRLKSMARSKDPGKQNTYFDEVEKILTQYLSDKFNLSAFGATRIDLERQLHETFGPEDPLSKDILGIYQICDESRFAKAQVPQDLKDKALQILQKTIGRVERLKR